MQASSFYPPCGLSSPLNVYRNLQQHRDYQWHRLQHSISAQGTPSGPNVNSSGVPVDENCNYSPYVNVQHRNYSAASAEKGDTKIEKNCAGWNHQFDNSVGQYFNNGAVWEKMEQCNPEFKLEYMDLDEFLLETNIDDEVVKRTLSEGPSFSSSGGSSQGSPNSFSQLPPSLASPAFRPFPLESPSGTQGGASPFCDTVPGPDSTASPLSSMCPESPADNPESPYLIDDKKLLESNDLLNLHKGVLQNSEISSHQGFQNAYGVVRESRAKRSRQKKRETNPSVGSDISFSSSELMLASLPGEVFDPRTRSFSEDELRPQPVLKKNRKQQYVPVECKDERYWARRRKNNVAAKRSRDARRTKENQIALRATYLEKENESLRGELDDLRTVLDSMKQRLSVYENTHHNPPE